MKPSQVNIRSCIPSYIYHCLVLCIMSLWMEYGQAVERIALVIGNAKYQENPLKNPVNDARDMAAVLEQLGFTVILKTDANLDTMVNALRDFKNRLSDGDVGLFYFSGHGIQFKNLNYLIPTDNSNVLTDEWRVTHQTLGVDDVLENMSRGDTRKGPNIMILDACRNTPAGRGIKGVSGGLAQISAPTGALIAYATKPGRTASDNPTGVNGTYTKHLLVALKQMPQADILRLFTEVRKRVNADTGGEQVPWESHSLLDTFCIAPNGCGDVPPPAQPTKDEPAAPPKPPVVTTSTPVGSPPCSNTLKPGTVCRDKLADGGLGPEMVIIPGGTFRMGSEQGDSHEKPVHSVTVKSFAMAKYEVTVAEFRQFVQATGYKTQAEKEGGCWTWTGSSWKKQADRNWQAPVFQQTDKSPVVCVSWKDATQYTQWLSQKTGKNYRLPTEAEWEYAARGGTMTEYYWGNDFVQACQYANVADTVVKKVFGWSDTVNCEDGYAYTAPVGSYQPNRFGLYDMVGNVWEWTCSVYTSPYDGNELTCAPEGEGHVLRGGSWYGNSLSCRSAVRNRNYLDLRFNHFGFRIGVRFA